MFSATSNLTAVPIDPAATLGRQIAALRKAKGLTQAGLAAKAGIKITAVRRCEQKGQIPLRRLAKLLAAMEATLQIHPPANRLPETWEGILRKEAAQRRQLRQGSKTRRPTRPMLGGLWDSVETAAVTAGAAASPRP